MAYKIKAWWDYIQALLDIDGDCWMGLFTAVVIARVVLVLKGYPPLGVYEAGVYTAAIGSFAYSNKGKP